MVSSIAGLAVAISESPTVEHSIDVVATLDEADELADLLGEIKERLESAQQVIDGRLALDDAGKEAVDQNLTTTLDAAEKALGAALPEGGLLGDYGSALDSNPDTLLDYASMCATLAAAALSEQQSRSDFDRDLVASRIKTIRALITRSLPHNYRGRAGLAAASLSGRLMTEAST